MLREELNLEEVFRYPVTSVPLSLAFPDSTLRQNRKHHFRNYLIDASRDCASTPPNEARWRIGSMSVMRIVKVKKTHKE